jgi:phosphoserine phosphatase RsbX
MTGDATPGALLEWGFAGAALDGHESGDLHLVAPFPGGALVALIDGLGHGAGAAEAARCAVSLLLERPQASVVRLFEHCHEGLRKTRGAVMSLATLDSRHSTIEWCGVGNVEGVLLPTTPERARYDIGCRGGVVGYRLPPLNARTIPLHQGDLLVFATDGIHDGFTSAIQVERTPQMIADTVLTKCSKGTDDALVLVVRYVGAAP